MKKGRARGRIYSLEGTFRWIEAWMWPQVMFPDPTQPLVLLTEAGFSSHWSTRTNRFFFFFCQQ